MNAFMLLKDTKYMDIWK